MKTLFALFLLTAATSLVVAQSATDTPEPAVAPAAAPAPVAVIPANAFPGLRIVMTPEEFAKAGLDALSPDQLEVINAAVARHYGQAIAKQANQQAEETQQAVQTAVAAEKEKSWISHVGLPGLGSDWKNQPSIKGTCTGWATGNSFKLDNGQVWEGVDPIRMELSGKEIEIQPRPNGAFALIVDGKNTTYRLIRIK
ncbi:MAG: hypothetical protein ABI222_06120 [Opitutaceae bacterium]